MKNLPLPQYINMLRFSEYAADFSGSLLIKDMQRLALSLYSEEGEVAVNLSLGVDQEGIRFCRVRLQADVVLQCQRCMEPFSYRAISDFLHGIVNFEHEAENLPGQYEPLITQEGVLIVQDMVEDELILRMPIVPMHPEVECKTKLPMTDSTWNKIEEKEQNPFQVLRLLKQQTNKEG